MLELGDGQLTQVLLALLVVVLLQLLLNARRGAEPAAPAASQVSPAASSSTVFRGVPRGTKAHQSIPGPAATVQAGFQAPTGRASAIASIREPASLPARGGGGRDSGHGHGAARAHEHAPLADGWDDTAAKGQPLVPEHGAASLPAGDPGQRPGRCCDTGA